METLTVKQGKSFNETFYLKSLADLQRTGLTGLKRWRARLGSAPLRLALTLQNLLFGY